MVIEIVTLGGDNHHPTHMGKAQISIKDDTSCIYHLKIPNALYFPSSPVNILSSNKISINYGDGLSSSDDSTCVKTTCGRSDFAWDHDKYFKTIFHLDCGLPGIIVNEK